MENSSSPSSPAAIVTNVTVRGWRSIAWATRMISSCKVCSMLPSQLSPEKLPDRLDFGLGDAAVERVEVAAVLACIEPFALEVEQSPDQSQPASRAHALVGFAVFEGSGARSEARCSRTPGCMWLAKPRRRTTGTHPMSPMTPMVTRTAAVGRPAAKPATEKGTYVAGSHHR